MKGLETRMLVVFLIPCHLFHSLVCPKPVPLPLRKFISGFAVVEKVFNNSRSSTVSQDKLNRIAYNPVMNVTEKKIKRIDGGDCAEKK